MADSIRSFCGPHAAPRTCFGKTEMEWDVAVFTCAKNPQKSQIKSAHLKFTGNRFSVFDFLHLGQLHALATCNSPHSPSSCLLVAMTLKRQCLMMDLRQITLRQRPV